MIAQQPVQAPMPAANMPAAPSQQPLLKVLIIDENEDNRDSYRRLLQRAAGTRFEIFEAVTAKDGLDLCKTAQPDCIILDCALPDAGGLAFIKAHQASFSASAAIVMITGTAAATAEAVQLGAHDYLPRAAVTEDYFVQHLLNAVERARLKDQVRACQKQLEKATAAMSEFTQTVSHDLRAPLTRISYLCSLLREEAGDSLNEDCAGYVERMQVNVKRLQHFIDDLLTYSRTLHNKEEMAQTDLQPLVASVIADLAAQIAETRAQVTAGKMPRAFVYPARLRQTFRNLIDNAIKYRNPKRPPAIRVACKDEGDHYLFSVADNGEGIDKKYLEKIFKPFGRLHTQDQIEGSGIGLATCQKVAEMHHGKIWAESEPGKGSTFYFTISK